MTMLNRLRNARYVFLFDAALILTVIFLAVSSRLQNVLDYERRCRETIDQKEKEEIALAAVDCLLGQRPPDSITR